MKETLDDGGPQRAIVRSVKVAEEAVLGSEVEGHGTRVVLNDRDVVVHDGELGPCVHLIKVVDTGVGNIVAKRPNQDGQDVKLCHPLPCWKGGGNESRGRGGREFNS